jgi:hypothetical protein
MASGTKIGPVKNALIAMVSTISATLNGFIHANRT